MPNRLAHHQTRLQRKLNDHFYPEKRGISSRSPAAGLRSESDESGRMGQQEDQADSGGAEYSPEEAADPDAMDWTPT